MALSKVFTRSRIAFSSLPEPPQAARPSMSASATPGASRRASSFRASIAARHGSSRPGRRRSGPERLVQRFVDQLVGTLVALARHRAHGPAIEVAQLAHGLHEERPQAGVLDLVLAADL